MTMERSLWKDGDFRALLKSLRETSNLAEAKKGTRGDTSGVPDAFNSSISTLALSSFLPVGEGCSKSTPRYLLVDDGNLDLRIVHSRISPEVPNIEMKPCVRRV